MGECPFLVYSVEKLLLEFTDRPADKISSTTVEF